MNNYQTIFMNLTKTRLMRLGSQFFVGKVPAANFGLGAGLLSNLEIYHKLFDAYAKVLG